MQAYGAVRNGRRGKKPNTEAGAKKKDLTRLKGLQQAKRNNKGAEGKGHSGRVSLRCLMLLLH